MDFIKINIISGIMFVFILIMFLLSESSSMGWIVFFGFIWLVFTIVSNYKILIKSKQNNEILKNSDKKGLFKNYIDNIQNQYDSVVSREEFFLKQDDSLKQLYFKIKEQMQSNIDSASAYMSSYDYVTKPEPTYIKELCVQGDVLVKKFNQLVEQIVNIDTNLTSLDNAYIDDVISCLNNISN